MFGPYMVGRQGGDDVPKRLPTPFDMIAEKAVRCIEQRDLDKFITLMKQNVHVDFLKPFIYEYGLFSTIHRAASGGCMEIFLYLMKLGADPNSLSLHPLAHEGDPGSTPLMGTSNKMTMLIMCSLHEVDVDAKNMNGMTALELFTRSGNLWAVATLLSSDREVTIPADYFKKNIKVLEALVYEGTMFMANYYIDMRDKSLAFFRASQASPDRAGIQKVARNFIFPLGLPYKIPLGVAWKDGIPTCDLQRYDDFNTKIMAAVKEDDLIAFTTLLLQNPDIDVTKVFYTKYKVITLISEVADAGALKIMRWFISEKADLNQRDIESRATPLMFATMANRPKMVTLLCSQPSVRTDLVDNENRTALWFTAHGTNPNALMALIASGNDLNPLVCSTGIERFTTLDYIKKKQRWYCPEFVVWIEKYLADKDATVAEVRAILAGEVPYNPPEDILVTLVGAQVASLKKENIGK